jgi:outer membrane protein TolC
MGQQRVMNLTLEDVVEIAKDQSPQSILAQHRFRASYWQHRTYRAEFLPSLNFTGTLPNFNRSIEPYTDCLTEVSGLLREIQLIHWPGWL